MTKKTKYNFQTIGTYLPIFPGFYGTVFEYQSDDIEYSLFNNPDSIHETLKSFICDNVWDCINYSDYQTDTCKAAVSYIDDIIKENTYLCDIVKTVEFDNVYSPKEYNFYNDSVNINLEVDFNKLLKAFMRHPLAGTFLKERYTSCSGFISHYPNNLKQWARDAYEDQDHTIGTMIEFLLMADDPEGEHIHDMYEYVTENIYSGDYINYDGLIEKINEKFTFNDSLLQWDEEQLANYEPIVGGTL